MAYETGTASDHTDLWNKLILFLTQNPDLISEGQAWEVTWEAPPGAPNSTDIVLKGPGMDGDDEILVGLRREADVVRNSFLYRMVGMTGLRSDANAYNEHINISDNVVMFVDQNPMSYWFVANGRRFVVVVKISTVYEAMYAGFFLPYCDPLAYPYPLVIGGSAGSRFTADYNWTNTQDAHSHFAIPYGYGTSSPNDRSSLYFCDPSFQWIKVDNGDPEFTSDGACMAPWKWNGGLGASLNTAQAVGAPTILRNTIACLGGAFTLHPATLVQDKPTDQTWGILDGIYHVPGDNNAAENIVTVNGVDHLVVQNVNRTTPDQYWALALE